jgi:hypothetical protein
MVNKTGSTKQFKVLRIFHRTPYRRVRENTTKTQPELKKLRDFII